MTDEALEQLTAVATRMPSVVARAITNAEQAGGLGFAGLLAGPLSPLEATLAGAEAALLACQAHGLPTIAAGGTRVVIRADADHVAKIGWHPVYGTRANRNEARIWSAAPDHVRDALADVVALLDQDVLIQRHATCQGLPLTDDASELVGQRAKLQAIGVNDDLALKQWGRLDDRLVCVDYPWLDPFCNFHRQVPGIEMKRPPRPRSR